MRKFARALVHGMPRPVAERIQALKRAVLNTRDPATVFGSIYTNNSWDGDEARAGVGSSLAATASIRSALPTILEELKARSVLDIPCGDGDWIDRCIPEGTTYTGADIVPAITAKNLQSGRLGNFLTLDVVSSKLPRADIVIVRDCFIHLPNKMIAKAVDNIRASGAKYLLTTTFPGKARNQDIEVGGFRPIDLNRPPFSFPPALKLIPDAKPGEIHGKHLGLWKLN